MFLKQTERIEQLKILESERIALQYGAFLYSLQMMVMQSTQRKDLNIKYQPKDGWQFVGLFIVVILFLVLESL